jgi:hypothetical protein
MARDLVTTKNRKQCSVIPDASMKAINHRFLENPEILLVTPLFLDGLTPPEAARRRATESF